MPPSSAHATTSDDSHAPTDVLSRASRDSRATRHVCGLSPSSALLVAEKLVYSHLLTPDSNSGRNQPAAATAVQLQIAAQIK